VTDTVTHVALNPAWG